MVYRLDRVSRDIGDFSKLISELERLKIDFISIREQFDTSSPMGRAMMYIASVFSQLERETIAERIRDNMHELAKTGRWLGGMTPTGFASESVRSVTVDGKARKACKLKVIEDEAAVVRKIFSLYLETDSLTQTEAEILRQRVQTKNGRKFTRFSIKAILQNPVYLTADEAAYEYFTRRNAEVFSDKSAFDGEHGILAYNRTDQEKGKSTVYLPVEEWIISVGKHPGLIPSQDWIKVQASLERNKNKSYRKPRSNEALLTGIIYCSCGNRMYPKLSNRTTIDGERSFSYACEIKIRSKKSLCSQGNVNGNLLDAAVIEQVKSLAEDNSTFIRQLEKSKRFYSNHQDEDEKRLSALRAEGEEVQRKISALVDSLADMEGSSAKGHVLKRIDELNISSEQIASRISEMERMLVQYTLSDIEFDVLRQLLSVFRDTCDDMSVEQKRAAIRTIVRKVIWDGVNTHVILFGVQDDEIEYPEIASIASENTDDDETEKLEDLPDVDYDEEDMEDDRLGKTEPLSASKTHWGEDSK